MIRTLNGFGNSININTIAPGDAISLSDSSSNQTVNVDISKQSAKTSISDTDVFILEESDGSIKKITGAHLKESSEQSTVSLPLTLSGNNIGLSTLNSYGTSNQYLKMNSGATALEYATLSAGTNLVFNCTEFSLKNPLTGNVTFDSTAIFNNLLEVKSSSSGGAIRFFENASNGSDKILLKGPDSLGQDFTITLPAASGNICLDTGSTNIATVGTITTGTWNGTRLTKDYIPTDTVYDADIASFITASSTDTFTNKSFGDLTTFSEGLYTKHTSNSSSSGFVRFYYNNSTDYLDLHGPASGTSARHVVIPATSGTLLTDVDDIPVDKGGTNITSYTVGDLLYATGSTTLAKLSIGSSDTFLMSNGTAPIWSAGYSFTAPLSNSGTAIKIEGLSGFGTAKQIIVSSGTDLAYSSTLDSVNLVGCTGNISQFTNNSNYVSTTALTTSVNFGTSAGASVSLGTNTQTLNLLGSTIQLNYLKPIQIALSGAGDDLIHHDTGIGGAQGAMVFGSKSYNSGIFGDDKIYLQTSNSGYKIELNVSSGGILYTAPDHVFAGNLSATGGITCTGNLYAGDYTDSKILRIGDGRADSYIDIYYHASSSVGGIYPEPSGSTRLYWNGSTVTTSGTWADISDSRVKSDQKKADTAVLGNAFDNIDLYTYNYTPQYAAENGKSSESTVYGWIAQNVIECTKGLSEQFGKVCQNKQTFPNGRVQYEGDRQEIDDLNVINKKDMSILLWAKVKEQQKIIDEMKTTIDKLNQSNSFKEFKS